MLDTATLTHVAAILVGVVVTLALVKGVTSSSSSSNADTKQSVAEGSSSSSQKKKKKKNKPKKNGTAAETSDTANGSNKENHKPPPKAAAAAQPTKKQAQQQAKEEESNKASSSGGKNKKNKKDNKKKGGEEAPANKSNNSNKETTGEKKKNGSNGTKMADSTDINVSYAGDVVVGPPEVATYSEMTAAAEEWNSVPVTKNKKKNKPKQPSKQTAADTSATASTVTSMMASSTATTPSTATASDAAAAAAAPAPAIPVCTDSVTVDGKRIGVIIGPKGATMNAIQDATGCKLDINAPAKDDINNKAGSGGVLITGPDKESIAKAKKAVMELASKGYATLLQSQNDPTFGEYYKEVHPRHLSEIVGPKGQTIQAIQNTLNVKLTIPSTDWKPNMKDVDARKVKPVKVGIAGSKENSKEAKAVIQSLVKYHHHEVTHPGMIHEETHVPREFFHCVIGPRGSEIKHIRGNFKVDVYMPNADDKEQENVLVVGRPTNVDRAITYIQTLMDRDVEQREKKFDDEFY